MKKLMFLFLMMCLGVTSRAHAQTSTPNNNAAYTIEVKGNCDQCKKRIEKAAYQVKGVKMASWDMDSHQLRLIINEEKTSLDAVETSIAGVGHDTPNHKAANEVYDNLHHCCKYDR